ncbi:hypothetical protein MmiAt1_03880 [Methanimicrococcus sp. At1]|uniref:DUF3784 domain-containing protein n=1 Tax=Methanimicrococcus hacksteinii TaxID=3028293 RepID=A0ABU3VN53_9EURY|nr:DUF3784 domain-containing protein [Methanimicrococcus sp. At1]MDV0444844.1 hypothetical protein [Methanimicrococcus sp. At1]
MDTGSLIYLAVMLFSSVLFFILGYFIYNGKTDLIHDYHQKNVTDFKGYGRKMGLAMILLGIGLLLSALLWPIDMRLSVAVLLIIMIAAFVWIYFIQKRYNGGVFS